MRRSSRFWPVATAAALLACGMFASAAADAGAALAQMNHTSWTARDGAPQGIRSLALAPDGTMWIGAETGLFNFDGHAFTPFHSPSDDVRSLKVPVESVLVARDGALWVGLLGKGPVRIAGGRMTQYTTADGEKLGAVNALREAADGGIWAFNQTQLIRFGADGAWHLEPTPESTPIGGLHIDPANTLWLAQGGRLYRRPLPGRVYEATGNTENATARFTDSSDGRLWMVGVRVGSGGREGRYQLVDRTGHVTAKLAFTDVPTGVAAHPDGSLVVALRDGGLRRWRAEQLPFAGGGAAVVPDAFTAVEGLSSNRVNTVLIDPDGSLWIGGVRGLDRLRSTRLIRYVSGVRDGRWSVCGSPQGEVWIGSREGELHRLAAGVDTSFGDVGDVYSLSCIKGHAWAATPLAMLSITDHVERIPWMPDVRPRGVWQVVAAADGTVYATVTGGAANGGGLWRYHNGQWELVPRQERLGLVLYMDRKGRVWRGGRFGRVTLITPEGGQVFSSGEPGVGSVYSMLQTARGFFAAGTEGLAVFRGSRFDTLAFADPAVARGIRGLVESGDGDLWLNALEGIVHVTARELEAALADPSHRIEAEFIADSEHAGAAQASVDTVARGGDGHLWFVARTGIVHLDPAQRAKPARAPILTIRAAAADGRPMDPASGLTGQPQTLAFQYLGVNLTSPEKVVYRHRLEGLEDGWQDVGHRTEALYSRLRPGTYTFRVIASNGDGVWTAPVSWPPITVLPSFYQTPWFAAACVLAAALLVWLAFTLRLRAVTRAVRARAEERADERIRIARDLHDTLLQGIQGLMLTFHVVGQRMAPNDAAKAMLDRALATADQLMIEGRDRVGNLRSQHVRDAELVAALQNVAADLDPEKVIDFQVSRSGTGPELKPQVADDAYAIAREAMTNAFRHASASCIRVKLDHGRRYFCLTCADDGRGFAANEGDRPGHWGLRGLAERAAQAGGEIDVRSAHGQGTVIRVVVPSYRGYAGHSRAMFWFRAWRPSERNPLRLEPAPRGALGGTSCITPPTQAGAQPRTRPTF